MTVDRSAQEIAAQQVGCDRDGLAEPLHEARALVQSDASACTNTQALLSAYAGADPRRAVIEVAITSAGFLCSLAMTLYAIENAAWLAPLFHVSTAAMIVRLFTIQHDCGHRSLFRSARVNDWVGRAISLVTLTPYTYWRLQHAGHHAASGNLDRRGIGDVPMLTVSEYRSRPWWRRLGYRLYRHPLSLFGLAPTLQFWLLYRVPLPRVMRYPTDRWSILGTDLALAALYGGISYTIGIAHFLLAFFPAAVLAGSAGVWLFYIQHHFPGTYWRHGQQWDFHAAAFAGCSLYDLPAVLHWVTFNIGFHHIHHLASRIPGYRLRRCFAENAQLQSVTRLSVLESLRCAQLRLWDENAARLVSIRDGLERGECSEPGLERATA
jgi:omega-6 fatty acid desaturase (delta-12 desaturase)